MRFHILALVAALVVPVLPVQAEPTFGGAVDVDVRLYDNQQAVFAVVRIQSLRERWLDADLQIRVNGRLVKIEPFVTTNQVLFNELLADAGSTVFACVRVVGEVDAYRGEMLEGAVEACTAISPESLPEPLPPPFRRVSERVQSATPVRPGALRTHR